MENTLQYKGYFTNITFSANDKVLHGKIEGIDDLVTFESESLIEIEEEFHNAVDDYLSFCEEMGKEPSKTYKGTFNVRIAPDLHRAIAINASKNGISLNQAVEKAISLYVASTGDSDRNNLMQSIDHRLSEITGVLGNFSTSCQITRMDPGYSYMTAVLPQTIDCWGGGKSQ